MRPLILTFQASNLAQRCIVFDFLCNKINVRRKANYVIEDNNIDKKLLEIINYKTTKNSNWIIESKINSLCQYYKKLVQNEKIEFLLLIATKYSVNHEKICELVKKLSNTEVQNTNQLILREKSLKDALTPPYHWLFTRVGRLGNGVKFLVDFRSNVLDVLKNSSNNSPDTFALVQMDATLKELLFLWFSVGFMKVERITWQTSCDILQKISDYEAIHPVKNWIDLKKRVGPYRRCFIFTHPSMPREPLVVLHTALCDIIPDSVSGIQDSDNRIFRQKILNEEEIEDKSKIKAAVFYSIASTQTGLQGIDLGNYLIKEVVNQVTSEFPMVNQLSSLSPIPKFRLWLLDQMKRDINTVFAKSEQDSIKTNLSYRITTTETLDLYVCFKEIFSNSLWLNNKQLVAILKEPLLRSCAWYLYKEKHRNYSLNNVANFHLRNGAVMWRLNWMADVSKRGMTNSCGIMVNYRYYIEETESNSINYIENYHIKASESVMDLVKESERFYATRTSINTEM